MLVGGDDTGVRGDDTGRGSDDTDGDIGDTGSYMVTGIGDCGGGGST